MRWLLCLLSIFTTTSYLFAQDKIVVYQATLLDRNGTPFEEAYIEVMGTQSVAVTDEKGYFKVQIPSEKEVILIISHLTINEDMYHKVSSSQVNPDKIYTIRADRGVHLNPFVTGGKRNNPDISVVEIEPNKLHVPNPSGDISTYIKTLASVNSNNELSSNYSVRGGNFDENLVYINGIEIYRPFFNRSGQSEGLGIVNTNMISNLSFSAGGFTAYHGDKLSSVLDITYKKPDKRAAVVEAGFLGGALHFEGVTNNYRLSYMVSGRYKSNKYLLNSLDVEGNYNPVFGDVQSYMTYRFGLKASLSWLGYYGSNKYLSQPESQTTKFGTVKDARQIDVFYEGQELTQYQTHLNALLLEILPHDSLKLQLSASYYGANEMEEFDILGQYYMSELDNDPGSETFGNPTALLGVGSYLDHARNALIANLIDVQHRGNLTEPKHNISWGLNYKYQKVKDELREWLYLDSAGYSVPRSQDQLELSELVISDLDLQTHRFSAYLMDEVFIDRETNFKTNIGVRTNFWDYNRQFLVAPRLSISMEPNRRHNARILKDGGKEDSLKKNIRLKAAFGFYQQPPFYRELRTKSGELVNNVKAQQSIHAVFGADWNFELWNRDSPFKFSSEFYYKYLWDMIPYEIENVRIRYLPEFTSTGYAVGAEFQVNGEFIPDLPSWFNFSIMTTREDIDGDVFINSDGEEEEVGTLVRPTDQRYAFNILFQDFLKKNEDYRVHLNLVFAHGLPFGAPDHPEFRNALRTNPYRRVDMGFSKVIFDRDSDTLSPSKLLRHTRHVSLSLDVFNLFGIRNTVSYLWIKDIANNEYAIPSYLTSRRFSLKLTVKF